MDICIYTRVCTYTCVYTHAHTRTHAHTHAQLVRLSTGVLCVCGVYFAQVNTNQTYEVASISRLPKNIGHFCKRAPQKRPTFCKRDLYF